MITIRINGRSIPATTYLAGIRLAKANPDRLFKQTLWGWWPGTGSEIVEQYRRDLHKRINERAGTTLQTSRVPPATWGRAQMPRVVLERYDIRCLNRHARPRLAHRQRDDACEYA